MLESIQINFTAVKRFIWKVVGIKDNHIDIKSGILFIQYLLNSSSYIAGTAYTKFNDLFSIRAGLVSFQIGDKVFINRIIRIIIKGWNRSAFVLFKNILGNKLCLICLDDCLIVRIVLFRCSCDDDIDKWII